ncbi:Uncharacterised protein [Chlamydia trachomatis]|nr:Uncharacterised protein [Chlamydia trachomatis]
MGAHFAHGVKHVDKIFKGKGLQVARDDKVEQEWSPHHSHAGTEPPHGRQQLVPVATQGYEGINNECDRNHGHVILDEKGCAKAQPQPHHAAFHSLAICFATIEQKAGEVDGTHHEGLGNVFRLDFAMIKTIEEKQRHHNGAQHRLPLVVEEEESELVDKEKHHCVEHTSNPKHAHIVVVAQ